MADEYDPYKERTGHIMTNNLETFIHLLKSSLGTGILAMPKAFSYVGLAEGAVLVYAMGAFCVYGLHLLVDNLYLVCKALRVPILQYGDGLRGAVAMGPSWLRPLQAASVYLVEFFLLTYQLGIACVYVAFAAKNLSKVASEDAPVPDPVFVTAVAAGELLLMQIRSLKLLAPVSLVANVAMLAGQVIVLYHVFRGLPPAEAEARPLLGPLSGLPHFAGTVLFAMESLGVIITLENNMAKPAAFTGAFGILNAGMLVVVTLYALVGFFGFYRYGPDVADVITLNLPSDWTGQTVKVVYALAVALTYPLQLWPVIEITWEKYALQRWVAADGEWLWLWETLYRSALVLLTYVIALALPNLDFVISLLGVFCLSMLGITFPALMEICTHFEGGYGRLKWILIKDVAMASVGILILVIGLWVCIQDLVTTESRKFWE